MISLQQLMLVLVTLGCRQWSTEEPATNPLNAGLAITGVALGFGLLFKMTALRVWSVSVGARQAGETEKRDAISASDRCSQARDAIEAAWVLCLPLTLLATGWGGMLQCMELAGLPQALVLVAWFLPSLMWLALMELTAAQVDELSNTAATGGAQLSDNVGGSWPQQWLARMRLGAMAGLVTCITPVLLIVAVRDGIGYWTDQSLAPHLLLSATLLTLAGGVFFLPGWLGQWMGVVDFPAGAMRSQMEQHMRELKIHGVALRLLPSRGRWPGAAIVGWFPRFRQLWLGDALLERLTSRQLEMVIMHELAHVSRKHYLWRLLPILAALFVVMLFGMLWPQNPEMPAEGGANNNAVASLVATAVASLVMLAGISFMAHRCELDADKTACLLAERTCGWAAEESGRAATELADALHCLLHDSPAAARTTWLHPSLAARRHQLCGWRPGSN